ncbi:MAG: DUF302 domain-containing protein [Proteobacteria bacterium]|nr:DUF302 domain-containing protein [Pseudomonadota bacterium]
MAVEGLITLPSRFTPKETADKLASAVASHGMTLVARVDHAAAAAKAGLDLRPTEVLIFGNPSAGTLLMQMAQPIGLDLPLKALVWQDDARDTWVSYQDLNWLAKRYGLMAAVAPTVDKMASLLKVVVEEATG